MRTEDGFKETEVGPIPLEQIQGKAQEAVEAEAEQQRSNLPGKAFAFLWVLRSYGVPGAEAKAREIESILDTYPGWPYSQKIEQTVRVALYRALVDQVKGGTSQLTEAVNNLLKMHRTAVDQTSEVSKTSDV